MIGFPLLLIPLAIVNIVVFLMRDVSFAAPVFTVPLPSGTGWTVTFSDVLLTFGILLLLLRGRQGRASRREISHRPSAVAAGGLRGAAAEFVLLPQFGTSTFFLLTLLALVDFLSGICACARGAAKMRPRRGLQAERARPAAERCRARTAIRTRADARARAAVPRLPVAEPVRAGSSRADDPPIRAHRLDVPRLAGNAVAGAAARQRYASAAGRAPR